MAANGVWFTGQEFMDAVGKLESTVRGKTGWFGSVDTHHVFYEGIMGSADDRYCIDIEVAAPLDLARLVDRWGRARGRF